MSNEAEVFDLDTDLEDVADLAQFTNPCDGVHIVGVVYAGADKAFGVMGAKIVYQLVATLEKVNEDDPDVEVGSLFSEGFTGQEKGKEVLKLRLRQIFDELQGSFGQFLNALNENFTTNHLLKITTRTFTKDGYENLRIMSCETIPASDVQLPEDWEWYDYKPKTEA